MNDLNTGLLDEWYTQSTGAYPIVCNPLCPYLWVSQGAPRAPLIWTTAVAPPKNLPGMSGRGFDTTLMSTWLRLIQTYSGERSLALSHPPFRESCTALRKALDVRADLPSANVLVRRLWMEVGEFLTAMSSRDMQQVFDYAYDGIYIEPAALCAFDLEVPSPDNIFGWVSVSAVSWVEESTESIPLMQPPDWRARTPTDEPLSLEQMRVELSRGASSMQEFLGHAGRRPEPALTRVFLLLRVIAAYLRESWRACISGAIQAGGATKMLARLNDPAPVPDREEPA